MNIEKKMKKNKVKYIGLAVLFIILIIACSSFSICMGTMKINLQDIVNVLGNKIFGLKNDVAENVTAVIWNIRFPRIICAIFVGMGLAVAGVIFQGILQNPLADPYTLGISTGAGFGAALAIIINIFTGIYFPVWLASFLSGLITLFIVIAIAKKGNSFESSNLIIAGIIISSILSSGISFIKMLAGENVGAIVFWIMGSLSAKGWSDVIFVAPIVIICIIISYIFSKQLDIMSLGDENAKSLGVDADRLRFLYLIIGSILTTACVCVCGVIGFVGLIVPHLLRFLITSENKVLLPMSALFGGVLLLVADSITRIFSAGEIPVGVFTTIIGGPFFIFVFTHRGSRKNG